MSLFRALREAWCGLRGGCPMDAQPDETSEFVGLLKRREQESTTAMQSDARQSQKVRLNELEAEYLGTGTIKQRGQS